MLLVITFFIIIDIKYVVQCMEGIDRSVNYGCIVIVHGIYSKKERLVSIIQLSST